MDAAVDAIIAVVKDIEQRAYARGLREGASMLRSLGCLVVRSATKQWIVDEATRRGNALEAKAANYDRQDAR